MVGSQAPARHYPLSTTHYPLPTSVQGDLNPRVRHGKAAGCRYIMDASSGGWDRTSGLLRFRQTLLPSELRRRTFSRRMDIPVRPEPAMGLEPTRIRITG